MAAYTLVCPFLTDDPAFAHGVEFGLLHARMQRGEEDEIGDFFARANQDRVLLLVNRLGWHVHEIKAVDRFWFWCAMKKRGPQHSWVG